MQGIKLTTFTFISSLFFMSCAPTQKLSTDHFAKKASWSDEFNYTGLPDSNKWNFDYGMGENGWGNQELQYYVSDAKNIYVRDGHLTIVATQEQDGHAAYHSSKIHSKGKADFLYGRIVVRAQVPGQRGTWPAAWMMPSESKYGQWPRSGEIDIMEHVGYDPNVLHTTIHTEAFNGMRQTHKTGTQRLATATTKFHVYRVDWTPEYIKGFIDDQLIFTYENSKKGVDEWPFDQPFHLILNLAIGGSWGGLKGVDNAALPASFKVDYVRYYPYLK